MIASNKYERIKHVVIQPDANQCMLIPQKYPPFFRIVINDAVPRNIFLSRLTSLKVNADSNRRRN